MAIPRPEEQLAESLTLPLRRDHHVHSPRSTNLLALHRHLHRHGRVLPDDGLAFAGDPDLGLAAGVVRVSPVLPLPTQPAGLGSVVAEDASVQRVNRAPVVRTKGSDLRHELLLAPQLF